MDLHIRIKGQRKMLRYTQEQLAKKVNVSSQIISNWERGYSMPSASDIQRLAEVLDCSSDYLLGRDVKPSAIYMEEMDIIAHLEQFKQSIEMAEGFNCGGDPLAKEAKVNLVESLELLTRQLQRTNKKLIQAEINQ